MFDEAEIRAAETALTAALQASDPTAWVYEYTEDAVFDGGNDEVVEGRDALLALAKAMKPMSSVSIRPRRTEGSPNVAAVWFDGSWRSNGPDGDEVNARGIIVWRKEADGHWRVALEHLT
jgi:ketosteroid isomerase-like protein